MRVMGELVFIGLGLHDENGMTLRGLAAAKSCDVLYAEFYTNLMPGLELSRLEGLVGKRLNVLSRLQIEEGSVILSEAKLQRVGFLASGDPMVATTHIDLRLRSEKAGVRTRLVHSSSVSSAVAGSTGLQSYKFGRTVSMPATSIENLPESVYKCISDNLSLGLHSLLLLEIDVEGNRTITIREAINAILGFSKNIADSKVSSRTLMVGVARLEAPDMTVRAGSAEELMHVTFGGPPHTLIIPGRLHFMEVEALEILCGASRE
jgi:diphthine synthase